MDTFNERYRISAGTARGVAGYRYTNIAACQEVAIPAATLEGGAAAFFKPFDGKTF